MNNYNDSYENALENINKSDKLRANYYSIIANRPWGDKANYDLYIDASLGEDVIVEEITNYINNKF